MIEFNISNLDKGHNKTVALVLALITSSLFFSLPLQAENEQSAKSSVTSHFVADYSDPIKTYQSYLEAIKRDDLVAAKACCTISDNNKSGSLDVLVGTWVTFHHFNRVMLLNFKEEASQYLRDGADNEENPYLRGDCTDKALDRTISRLAGSKFKIEGDTAKLTIQWKEDDGSPNQAIFYSPDDRIFRKINGHWKLDIAPGLSPKELLEFLEPGSWGCAFRGGMNMLNGAIEEVKSGKLKTWQEVTEELEKRNKVFEQKWAENHDDPAVRSREQIQSKDVKPTKGNDPTKYSEKTPANN